MAIRKRLVCLIDDDPLVCGALKFTLQDHGFDVVVAEDCASGLNAALDCDAVLTDLNIPDGDGVELIQELRRRRPHLHIVAMTGGAYRGGDDLMALAIKAGADFCLSKPFKPGDLLRDFGERRASERLRMWRLSKSHRNGIGRL